MSKVFISSDWHLYHQNITKFRHLEYDGVYLDFRDEQDHREWLLACARQTIKKRDLLILLGTIIFEEEGLKDLLSIPGRKILVKGNHDVKTSPLFNQAFERVEGLTRYNKVWLSHAPIHPDELRGRMNFHGHVHHATIPDDRYFNCCIDNLYPLFGMPFVEYKEIEAYVSKNHFLEDSGSSEV